MSAKKKKRKKKNRFVAVKVLAALLILAALGLGAWYLWRANTAGGTTAVVQGDSLGNYYSGTLVIARNESLTETENKTRIDFVAQEGSRVSRQSVICKVYSSGYNQTEINRLQTYREEIQNYHVNQVMSTYVDAVLDSENEEISSLALQVRTLVQGRGVGSLSNLENQLTSALSSRKSYLRQKYPDDQTLSELYKVESDQLKKIESWTTTYTAKEDCIVSFYTDGYESTVNANTYQTMSPGDVRSVIRGVAPEQSTVSRGSDPLFRTVLEDEWYALFLCTDRDWNPVVGESYQMKLEGFDNYVVNAKVESFSRIGSDLLLRMSVRDQSVEPVLNIRTCGATVGDFVSGVRVPMSALYAHENRMGVIVLESGVQVFVEVTVISYGDDGTAFVSPTLDGSPLQAGKTVLLF